jgi:ABC-2 type transport system permease protein
MPFMKKILLILKREYLVRVQKKSFILMTLLGPLLMGGLTVGSAFLAARSIKDKVVQVVDESGLFKGKFVNNGDVKFDYTALALDKAKQELPKSDYQALLYIPTIEVNNPKGITLFADKNVSMMLQNQIEDIIDKELENIKLQKAGIDKKVLEQTKSKVMVGTIALSAEGEKDSNSGASFIVAYACAFLIYISVFIYGAQVMRGVLEEKTTRIVEVIISSVKPFQLMMGKILGVALVGLTQFFLWIVLSWAVVTATALYFAPTSVPPVKVEQALSQKNKEKMTDQNDNFFVKVDKALETQNIPLVVGSFLFYFLGGYLLYSALFAAVGAAADNETDTQQFMLPITIPLIASFIVAQVVLQDPDGTVAFWLSMIPLTSPIIMMVRIPFGVPGWQLALSMALLVAGFIGTTWLAARIYRVGILMYGKKVNFKEISKWLFYKV